MISTEMLQEIRLYLDEKKSLPIVDKDYLLVRANGKKLYPKYVYLTVKKYLSFVTTVPSSARISPVEASTTSSASL